MLRRTQSKLTLHGRVGAFQKKKECLNQLYFSSLLMQNLLNCSPDIETASAAYEKRFSGHVGEFFLKRQADLVLKLLPKDKSSLKILEVGGGHCQLSEYFLKQGHQVWIQGSDQRALWRIKDLSKKYPNQVHSNVSPFLKLDFEAGFFDVVVAIRLISHFDEWQKLILEMCRVSKNGVIIDFPPKSSFNIFYPILFNLKRKVEKDTRTFLSFEKKEICSEFAKNDFTTQRSFAQFFFPMVLHRFLKQPKISKILEQLAEVLGLTKLFGSPLIFLAQKKEQ